MSHSRRIRRYSAFFQGWAQAFGNHKGSLDEEKDLNWLFGEDVQQQVGLIMSHRVKRRLYHLILAEHRDQVHLSLGPKTLGVDEASLPCCHRDKQAGETIRALLNDENEVHMYLSYHLFYPPGTRILTLSPKAPLPIIYKEIAPLQVTYD